MVPPRRPSRPGRPTSASARRRQPDRRQAARQPGEEVPEGEEEFEEAPPPPQGPSVTMMIGLGAALLFSVLLGYLVLSKRGYLIEIENMSDGPLQNVSLTVNGAEFKLGNFRPNEINGTQAACSPGNDIEIKYTIPLRGTFVKKLPKKDQKGNPLELDFAEYKGRCRIRLANEGIKEVEY